MKNPAAADADGTGAPLPLAADAGGAFPIRIARDGVWYYDGSPIRRMELARLFSTVLRRDDDGRYWLETPAERGTIEVDDAPFTAVELAAEGEGQDMVLRFRNNFDDWVTAGPGHPISVTFDPATGEPSPYIRVRDGLDALIVRSVFYELVDIAANVRRNGRQVLGVWSDGAFFQLGECA
ncbi:MAG: DUF1285 domain-containing protein [Alphaproteobacteria bacterium]|nr:DUF1285 domain-containing protein [Alphaproteobacteria bacterium]